MKIPGVYPEVDRIERYIWDQAKQGRTVTYKQIGLHFDVQWEHAALAGTLAEISRRSYLDHDFMLSAMVIRVDSNDPGDGFYVFAQELGFAFANTRAAKEKFWLDQVNQSISQARRLSDPSRS